MTDNDNSQWYAFVRYLDGKKSEYVPIINIKERRMGQTKKTLFNPQHLSDFDNTKWYYVKTLQDSVDGQPHRFSAQIGRLGENLVSLEANVNSKRIKWAANLNENEPEPESTAAEEDAEKETTNPDVTSARAENRARKQVKKNATDAVHEKILLNSSHVMTLNDLTRQESDVSTSSSEVALRREVEELKTRLRRKEREEEQRSKSAKQVDKEPKLSDVLEELRALAQSVEGQGQHIRVLEQKIDDYFKSPTPSHRGSSSSTAEVSVTQMPLLPSDQAVLLGDGFYSSETQTNALKDPNRRGSEWAMSLLEGVFKEDAHLMRTKRSKKHPECKVFPARFLPVAKGLYKLWLDKATTEDPVSGISRKYSETEKTMLCDQLPAYLATRSYSKMQLFQRPH